MAEYRLTTSWRFDAPIERVYEAICQPVRWPNWWRSAQDVIELRPGDERGVGRLLRCTWKGLLPYTLTFTVQVVRVLPLVALEGIASGDLEGIGRWIFSREGSITAVYYDWRVRTTRLWMNVLAPIASPMFEWNHNVVMHEGAKGLARLLDARLINLMQE